MRIRDAVDGDWERIWPIWHAIVAAGTTYDWDPDTDRDTAERYWMLPPPFHVVVAEDEAAAGGTVVVGTAKYGPNRGRLGDHVANASFMVAPDRIGQGVGRRLVTDVLDRARAAGFQAMQFNAVVETNTGAVALYRSLGFDLIGTIPEAFRHAVEGPVGLHIMYRRL